MSHYKSASESEKAGIIYGFCQCKRYSTADTRLAPVQERLMRHVATCKQKKNGRIRFADGNLQFVTGYDGKLPGIAQLTSAINWVKRRER